jgi:uncharacterized protein (DUF2141 family)
MNRKIAGMTAVLLAGILMIAAQAEPDKGKLIIRVTDLSDDKGTVNLSMYDSAKEYSAKNGAPVKKMKARIEKGHALIEFDDVPYGEYGFKLYHDQNGNGVMDRNFLGIPQEDYAFSNNAAGRFGSPSYDKVKFRFGQKELRLDVKMGSAGE